MLLHCKFATQQRGDILLTKLSRVTSFVKKYHSIIFAWKMLCNYLNNRV